LEKEGEREREVTDQEINTGKTSNNFVEKKTLLEKLLVVQLVQRFLEFYRS
jgi:hypothetical protein